MTFPPLRLGWTALCVAGGGAYYFAKRSVNADRAARYNKDMQHKRTLQNYEFAEPTSKPPPMKKKRKPTDDATTAAAQGADPAGSPSAEASGDPAPTRHAPESGKERSRFEAAEPYRSKKGDRFS